MRKVRLESRIPVWTEVVTERALVADKQGRLIQNPTWYV